jgi:predicted DNA-binding transcriptional regulator AlpA
MSEKVSLADIARYYGLSRAAVAKWRAEPDFPPVEKVGRNTRVDLAAVQRWRADRQADTEMRHELVEYEREIRELRGRLWRRLRDLMGSVDAGLILRQAGYDELELRRLAVQYLVEACDD